MNRVIITLLALIFSSSLCMGQLNKELEAQKEREAQERQLEQERQKAEQESLQNEMKYQKFIESAESNFNRQNYVQAKSDYEEALKIKPSERAVINSKIAEIDRKIKEAEQNRVKEAERDRNYQTAISSAESNFKQRKYEQAKQDYKSALALKPENAASINSKIAEIDKKILDEQYQKAISSAESNFSQRKYEQAMQDYKSALALKPENAASINPKIAEVNKKMTEPATLYIYRKLFSGTVNLLPKNYDVLLDNSVVGKSKSKWKTTVAVKTFGKKTLSAKLDKKTEIQINFEPGGVYYVRCGIDSKTIKLGTYTTKTDSNGKTTRVENTKTEYTPTLQLVDKSVGKSEFDSIK